MNTDELNIWLDGVPVVEQNYGDYEFNVWLDGVPVVEKSEEGTPPEPPTPTPITRRRTFIF